MPPAEYVCAGEMESLGESTHHFGLATPIYTHFTSPIRRYADQVVHRMAAAAIGWEAPAATLDDGGAISELARSLNERHASAKDAERASAALYALVYFRGRTVVETGYATFLSANGLTVLVPRFGIEAWAFAAPSGGPSPFRWCPAEKTLSAVGCQIRTMDRVTVRVSLDTSKLHPCLALELLDDASGEPLEDVLRERSKRDRAAAATLPADVHPTTSGSASAAAAG